MKNLRERDLWLHENRLERGGAENLRGESRAKHSGGERKFQKFLGNNECLVTRIVEIGITNQK
jgi:hypothetical protein